MAKYHVNDRGDAGPCRAQKGKCPFGDSDAHYDTGDQARGAFEATMRREDLFQTARQAIELDGLMPLSVKRAIRIELLELRKMASPNADERDYLRMLGHLMEQHEANRTAQNEAVVGPAEPKRMGEVFLEEQDSRIIVTDMSTRPLGVIVPRRDKYEVFTKEKARLGAFESKAAAAQALEAFGATLYKMSHQPDEDGALGYDVETHFPDFYSRPQLYVSSPAYYRESARIIMGMRNNPEATVTIYRSLPDASLGIEPGNWITLSRKYAETHGEQHDGSRWPVVSMEVKAKDIRSPGDDINEWGYYPVS